MLDAFLHASPMPKPDDFSLARSPDAAGPIDQRNPMDRLICGGRGFRQNRQCKLRAAFACCRMAGLQVAIVAPTNPCWHASTINPSAERFRGFPLKYAACPALSAQKRRTPRAMHHPDGHAGCGRWPLIWPLLAKSVKFKNLGLPCHRRRASQPLWRLVTQRRLKAIAPRIFTC